MSVLSQTNWQAREAAHHTRIDALTSGHLHRRVRGQKHPVNDFLFDYYGFSPAKLRRWHPGAGVALEGAAGEPRAGWKFMRATAEGTVELDSNAFLEARGRPIAFITTLLQRTLERPMQTGCFGLHEWAMVYRQPAERRHTGWSLRLGADGTDAVLDASTLRCTHFDATRFFTPEGATHNEHAPTRDTMLAHEQPGCVHAGMDVYRWAFKLTPAVPSDLIADAFELAMRLRTLDMQASPYDFAALGYEPVKIETADGRREYAARQRDLGEQANVLRRRLLGTLAPLSAARRPLALRPS